MSGIAGIIRFDGAPVEPGLIEKMTGLMPYRGPDGIRHWVKGGVALGQCMLCTTPESLEEQQPLCNEDESLVLVMDGRVDNWEELRRELLGRGAVLRTRADAELVLRAYEAWGRDCLSHIDGDFALVIWDARRHEAFCARDRIGKKTFTYHWDGKRLAFASELHAILALPGMREELNEGMLAEFLAMEWYSRDETFWKGIYRLIAAHRMVVGADGPRIDEYWMPDLWRTLPYTRDEEYVEHYRALLFDVVRSMSRSHQPVAYEVSGGLDSSALFAVAEHLRRDGKLPAPAIEGYTLAFENAPDAEERQYARAVGAHLGVEIHECPATTKSLAWYREWARQYREFPGYPNGVMATALRQSGVVKGARALVAGMGGDQWLGVPCSEAYYPEEIAARRWRELGGSFLDHVRSEGARPALWLLLRYGFARFLPGRIKRPLRVLRSVVRRRPTRLAAGLQDALEKRRRAAERLRHMPVQRHGQRGLLGLLSRPHTALAIELEERQSARLGLELRYPYFDKRIVQLAFSTPERLRSRPHVGKRLHRVSMAGLLPPTVLQRMDKAEFTVTFRRQLEGIRSLLRDSVLARRADWLPPGAMSTQGERHLGSFAFARSARWLWIFAACDALLERDPPW